MKSAKLFIGLFIVSFVFPTIALAKPEIALDVIAEKKIVVIEDGQEVTKRVKAEAVTPGETIFYTVQYVNNGDETATNVVINDPIPEGAAYIPGSASDDEAEVSFSIDGGETFKKASVLTYEVELADGTTEKRVASPEKYTHIRWVIEEIGPDGGGELRFQVRLK